MTAIDRSRIDHAALPSTLSPSDIAVLARFGVPASALTLKDRRTLKLKIQPIGLRAANAYVEQHHRHHKASRGHKFSVSVVDEAGRIRGVGIAGRPVSRMLDQDQHLEVVRVCTDGTRNACSMIYGALRRAGIALGYEPHKIITYTLATEPGGSLRAAGWHDDGIAGGGEWGREDPHREVVAPTEKKRRWRAALSAGGEGDGE